MAKQKKLRIYVAGPMTGIEDHNKPRLRALGSGWANAGYEVVNPANFFDVEPHKFVARKRAIKELMTCDALAVLPEWVDYPDSFVHDEIALAKRLGIPVHDARYPVCPQPLIESVLEEAQRIVYGTRQQEYGHPIVSLTQIAELWTGFISARTGSMIVLLKPDVANMFILAKMARTFNAPNRRDSWVDMAGWAGVGARALNIDP